MEDKEQQPQNVQSRTASDDLASVLREQSALLKHLAAKIERIDKQLRREMYFRWVRYVFWGVILFMSVVWVTPYVVEVYTTYQALTQRVTEFGANSFMDFLQR